ncbi:MAG: GNAT family N-acetyltransferase [Bryobacteraceae bacterium]
MPEAVSLIARNLRSVMSGYSRSTPKGELADYPGVAIVSSGIDYSVFNATVFSEAVPHTEMTRFIEMAAGFYKARKVGWSCWFSSDLLESGSYRHLARLLETRGLQFVADHQGMVAERLKPVSRKLPAVDVRPVTDEAGRRDFVHVCAHGFGLPGRVAEQIYGGGTYWSARFQGWVAYANGGPVAIGATEPTGDVIGVYSVATMSAFQGRGYGESITRHAVEQTRKRIGATRTILQATPAGMRMYRRMGYEPCGRFVVFATP